ncbi:hypothetical protein [Dyadobacter aurulentus]|uniref:hypothetical protein n=1 Tax=Dyadobacter sp. UC 10 TaxID=2605428 RepID=UPI0011F229C4|nr:hypothetical protein [Dyadobacter sp. UC 10]KAA0989191.1 hypothetical protein FXO21_02920 [Dyadobacter sp. UC 10]
MKFEELQHFNFKPLDANAVLLDATLILTSEIFYWADFAGWEIGDADAISISGKKLFWRLRPELIGNIKRINDD